MWACSLPETDILSSSAVICLHAHISKFFGFVETGLAGALIQGEAKINEELV